MEEGGTVKTVAKAVRAAREMVAQAAAQPRVACDIADLLIVMDTAGYDISSVTSMVAAGCQAVIFTTGRGTPTGNAIAPVLKVTANEHTYSWMEDNMDVDLSPVIRGEQTIEAMGERLVDRIAAVAGGQMTKLRPTVSPI